MSLKIKSSKMNSVTDNQEEINLLSFIPLARLGEGSYGEVFLV